MKSKLTLVIPTYNSENHLLRFHELYMRLMSQSQGSLSILIVDGGSVDNTLSFEREFGFTIVINYRGDPVNAKYLGFTHANTDLVAFLDHDEIFLDLESINKRIVCFEENSQLVGLFSSGYRVSLANSTTPNIYSSKYGDPFNFYVYGSRNDDSRISELDKCFYMKGIRTSSLNITYHLIEKFRPNRRFLLECSSMGVTIHKERLRNAIPDFKVNPIDLPNLFYLVMAKNSYYRFGILQHDFIDHFSSESWTIVKNKLRWRINNQTSETSNKFKYSGIAGRFAFENQANKNGYKIFSKNLNMYKLRYVFHCFTVVPLLFDTLRIIFYEKNWRFCMHAYLSLYTIYCAFSSKFRQKNLDTRYGL